MGKRDFAEWLNTFTDNINTWDYYINYQTAYKNTSKLKRQLALLGTLRGSKDIENEFRDLVEKYPECLEAVPLLLAVRDKVIAITDKDRRLDYNFESLHYDIELYIEFMEKTGIFELLQNHVIGDLLDVGLGINIGLDSNARKNRGGHQIEDLVEARSFKTIALEAENIDHVHFIWFTDGAGWHKTKGNLQETFLILDDIYNIADLKNGIISKRFRNE